MNYILNKANDVF